DRAVHRRGLPRAGPAPDLAGAARAAPARPRCADLGRSGGARARHGRGRGDGAAAPREPAVGMNAPLMPTAELLFGLAFPLAAPFWFLMIVLPGWSWTRRIISSPWIAVPPLVVYLALLVPQFAAYAAP